MPPEPCTEADMTQDDRSPPVIAEKIRESIRSGALQPGSHLGAAALAEQFGVSRGPVREALRLLESAGLVRIVPQKGAFVIALGDADLRELFFVREVLYAALAERCAQRMSPADLAMVERAVSELAALADDPDCSPTVFQRMADRVVAKLYRISGMPRLSRMIQDLSAGPAEVWGHLSVATREMRLADLKGFQRLLKALKDGDAAASFAAARTMHAGGVARAIELNDVIRHPAATPAPLKRSRRTPDRPPAGRSAGPARRTAKGKPAPHGR
jgi:DNA-binding GntR family transcriptional regulator